MKLCEAKHCTGCCACSSICPRNAITMVYNEHGVLLPEIDSEKCVDCGRCTKVCPILRPVQYHAEPRCFVAWSRDAQLRKNAASAGVISTLSQGILRAGGVVFGTRYCDGRLIFDHIEEESEIVVFQGSKYVHAYVGNAYKKAKQYLEQGRQVLFPGTPCQVAGLKNYLGREYGNLLTVDLICHGVTTEKYLHGYLCKEKNKAEYDRVLFRGERGQMLVAYRGSKVVRQEEKLLSPFYMAYAKGMIHRENCYICPFASANRCGDLTAGDFWGINRGDLPLDAQSLPYPSLMLVNTQKGWENLLHAEISFEERSFEEAAAGNGQLSGPCKRNPCRDQFLRDYPRIGFIHALRKTSFYRDVRLQANAYRIRHLLSRIKHTIFK